MANLNFNRSLLWQISAILLLFFSFLLLFYVLRQIHTHAALKSWFSNPSRLDYVLFIIASALLFAMFVPASVLSAAAFIIFGFSRGAIAVIAACLLSSIAVFMVCRYFFRNQVQRWIMRHERFRIIQEALEQEGLRLLCLSRYNPAHATFMNGLLAVSRIKGRAFLLSCACLVPEWILFTYLAYMASVTIQMTDSSTNNVLSAHNIYAAASIFVFIVLFVYVMRVAQKALARASEKAE
jgi:uncharacterized membrane protein YdjX (TVP38/TMEM64 family)